MVDAIHLGNGIVVREYPINEFGCKDVEFGTYIRDCGGWQVLVDTATGDVAYHYGWVSAVLHRDDKVTRMTVESHGSYSREKLAEAVSIEFDRTVFAKRETLPASSAALKGNLEEPIRRHPASLGPGTGRRNI